jgi:hypothetical protein
LFSRLAAYLTPRLRPLVEELAALFGRRLRMPGPGETVVWWTTFTGDSHYYQLTATLESDPHANEDMPWVLDLARDRQYYDRKVCPTQASALDLQAAWKRMVRKRGLGRVYWVGSASMGSFDILIVEREGEWRLLLYVKDRYAETRRFATEDAAVQAGHALEIDLRSRPWFSWEPPPPSKADE